MSSIEPPPLYERVVELARSSSRGAGPNASDEEVLETVLDKSGYPIRPIRYQLRDHHGPKNRPNTYLTTEELDREAPLITSAIGDRWVDYVSNIEAVQYEGGTGAELMGALRSELCDGDIVDEGRFRIQLTDTQPALDPACIDGIDQFSKSRWVGEVREDSPVESLPPLYAYMISDVTLYGDDAAPVTNDGEYILTDMTEKVQRAAVPICRAAVTYGPYDSGEKEPSPQQVGTAISLTSGAGNRNYYHWFVDCITMIRAAEAYANVTGKMPVLLRPQPIASWKVETLKCLGYWKFTEPITEDFVHVDRFITTVGAHQRTEGWAMQTEQIRWLNEVVTDAVPPVTFHDRLKQHVRSVVPGTRFTGTDRVFPKRMYLSRRDMGSRTVADRKELLRALPGNFAVCLPARVSFTEQVQLFRNAETVVAPHGAALANILWTDELNVVEIFGDKQLTVYTQIAETLGHNYACRVFPEDEDGIHVDVAEISDTVRLLEGDTE